MELLAQAVRRRNEWNDEIDRLVVQAMNAKVKRDVIADTIGKSREHLRTIKDRVEKRARQG